MRRRTTAIDGPVGVHENLAIYVVGNLERLQVDNIAVRGPAIVCRNIETAAVMVFDNLSDRRFWDQILTPSVDEWVDPEEEVRIDPPGYYVPPS